MKNNKGITLIALVLTIVIIMILVGVSIGYLDKSGLLTSAKESKESDIIGHEKEHIEVAYNSAFVKKLGENINKDDLQEELDIALGENITTVTGTGTLKVKFEETQHVYKVYPDGTVEKQDINPNLLDASDLYASANTYFGWDVINYAETLPAELQDTEWQLFYAGALEGQSEERIYLISKLYVKNTVLPSKNGAKPIATNGSSYTARFGSGVSDGIMPQYTSGSNLITQTQLQALNSDYFKDYTSTGNNMRVVAYMMDTTTWSPFATSSNGYAEYAIGGPTIELLFKAYNKYKGTAYESDAISSTGYQVRKTSSDIFENSISDALETTNTPYVIQNSLQASCYWLASPSYLNTNNLLVAWYNGKVDRYAYYDGNAGFRPIVLLNSNFQLEKTKDSNENNVFRIVAK